MRNGRNPNQGHFVEPRQRINALVITHLPNRIGYHSNHWEVIGSCLNSLRENTKIPLNLAIWDNGSCGEFVHWLTSLKDACFLDSLMLSENVGKTNALKMFMRILPPNSILSYSDDDVEFFSGWLEAQLEILETYPDVGTVTGCPTKLQSTWATSKTREWAVKNATVEEGKFICDEWEWENAESLGEEWGNRKKRIADVKDFKIEYKGVESYALSHHFQFLCYPERIERFIDWTQELMPAEHLFDERIDEAGLLRLSTVERYARHIGNVLDSKE